MFTRIFTRLFVVGCMPIIRFLLGMTYRLSAFAIPTFFLYKYIIVLITVYTYTKVNRIINIIAVECRTKRVAWSFLQSLLKEYKCLLWLGASKKKYIDILSKIYKSTTVIFKVSSGDFLMKKKKFFTSSIYLYWFYF